MSQAISAAALKIMVVDMKCAPHFLLDRLRKTAYDHMCSHEHSGRDYKGMTLIFHFFQEYPSITGCRPQSYVKGI